MLFLHVFAFFHHFFRVFSYWRVEPEVPTTMVAEQMVEVPQVQVEARAPSTTVDDLGVFFPLQDTGGYPITRMTLSTFFSM